MKKLLFAISITMFSLLGLHAYAADNAAMTHGLKSNHMRNMDSRSETMPATDPAKPATEEKKTTHKKTTTHHKKSSKKMKKHPAEKKK